MTKPNRHQQQLPRQRCPLPSQTPSQAKRPASQHSSRRPNRILSWSPGRWSARRTSTPIDRTLRYSTSPSTRTIYHRKRPLTTTHIRTHRSAIFRFSRCSRHSPRITRPNSKAPPHSWASSSRSRPAVVDHSRWQASWRISWALCSGSESSASTLLCARMLSL